MLTDKDKIKIKKGRVSTLAQYRYSMWQDIYMYIVCQRFLLLFPSQETVTVNPEFFARFLLIKFLDLQ